MTSVTVSRNSYSFTSTYWLVQIDAYHQSCCKLLSSHSGLWFCGLFCSSLMSCQASDFLCQHFPKATTIWCACVCVPTCTSAHLYIYLANEYNKLNKMSKSRLPFFSLRCHSLKSRNWGPKTLLQHVRVLGRELRKMAWGEEGRAGRVASVTAGGCGDPRGDFPSHRWTTTVWSPVL